jgi:PBP1b-binding outer membrane lipoprotein LpoB
MIFLIKKHYVINLKIMIIIVLFLNGCVGDKRNINKEINNDTTTEEIKRERTPNAPRINIPTHTF